MVDTAAHEKYGLKSVCTEDVVCSGKMIRCNDCGLAMSFGYTYQDFQMSIAKVVGYPTAISCFVTDCR